MKQIAKLLLILIVFIGWFTITVGAFSIESVDYDSYFNKGDTVNLYVEVKNDDNYEIWTHATIKDPNKFGGEITKTEWIGAGKTYTFHFSFKLNKESDYLGDIWVSDAMGSKEVKETFRFISSDGGGGSRIEVSDLDTGEPIEGASVTVVKYLCVEIVDEQGHTTENCDEVELTEEGNTNSDGCYYTNLSYPGCYFFSASKEGYNCDDNRCGAGGYIDSSRFFDVSLELSNNSSENDNANSDDNSIDDDNKKENDTPGFTIIILMASSSFILFWKKRGNKI